MGEGNRSMEERCSEGRHRLRGCLRCTFLGHRKGDLGPRAALAPGFSQSSDVDICCSERVG